MRLRVRLALAALVPQGTSGTEYDSLRIVSDKEGRMVRVVEWLDSGDEEEES